MAKANWVALLVILIIIGSPAIFLESTVQATSSNDDWAQIGHDAGHTGYSRTNLPKDLVPLWNFSGVHIEGIATSNGRIFFCSRVSSTVTYCINATDGRLLWSSNSSLSQSSPPLCPAIADGIVYTDTNAYNASTGQLIFNYKIYEGSTSPTVANGMIFLGTNASSFFAPGGVVAINARTGQRIWSFTGEIGQLMYGGMVQYPPVYANGVVYFCSGGGIYALNAGDGHVIWRNSGIDKGTGSLGHMLAADGQIYALIAGRLYSLGSSNWDVKLNLSSFKSLAFANGTLFIDSNALDASNGKILWNVGITDVSSPAISGDIVYYGHDRFADTGFRGYYHKRDLLGLDALTGTLVWNYTFPGVYNTQGAGMLAIGEGVLYISQSGGWDPGDSGLFAFGSEPSVPEPPANEAPDFTIGFALFLSLVFVLLFTLIVFLRRRKNQST